MRCVAYDEVETRMRAENKIVQSLTLDPRLLMHAYKVYHYLACEIDFVINSLTTVNAIRPAHAVLR